MERCAGGCGGGRLARGAQREAGAEWRGAVEPARWWDTLLPLERWGPRVRGCWRGRAAAAGAWDLRWGFVPRVSEELRGAFGELSSVCVGPVGLRSVGAAPAALRARGREGAGRGFRAGGDRGPGSPGCELALWCFECAGAGQEPATLQEGGPHLPYGVREPGEVLRLPWGCDLRSLPHPRARGYALPCDRLAARHPLLPREDGVLRPAVRYRGAGGGLLPRGSPDGSEVFAGCLRLGQAQPRGGGVLAPVTAPDPDLLGAGGQDHACLRGRGVRAAQPSQRATRLQGRRPPSPRRARGSIQ